MNRLARETSPYLLAHADNPVDWRPWGEPAIDRARATDRPILLSIGYSSCHWCHVMARESFAHTAIAELMNELFVNIKVDREERPDLDSVYQLGHRILNGRGGGWPLTAFLDAHTLLPFLSGTYFPPRRRHGLPGFGELLRQVAAGYASRRNLVKEHGVRLAAQLEHLQTDEPPVEGDPAAPRKGARKALGEIYDPDEGGFGGAPKFPMPAAIERLLRHWAASRATGQRRRAVAANRPRLVVAGGRAVAGPDQEALNMVLTTLTKMARGGIFDHLGGGFFRYATDRSWAVPHFEKMLGDNGALLALFAEALGVGPDALFETAVRGTAGWLQGEMQHPCGGYRAAQDADSEGEDGRFYVWRRDAVKRLLTEDEHLVVETLYGLDKPANFDGRWHLRRQDAWRAVVERLYMQAEPAAALLRSAHRKLLAARAQRPPPATDAKVLAGWNGLAIRGMALAATRLREPAWLRSARRAADFARTRMVADGRLRAVWTNGVLGPPALLDDHANLLHGLLALLSADWRDEDYAFALRLGEAIAEGFEDERRGGFYLTAHDHESLIHRPKPVADDALPPGNAVAIRALTALARLAGETRFADAAHRAGKWAVGFAEQDPANHCALVTALEDAERPGEVVIVRGPAGALAEWLNIAQSGYHPGRACYGIPTTAKRFPEYLPARGAGDETVTAFVCRDFACSTPMRDLASFEEALATLG